MVRAGVAALVVGVAAPAAWAATTWSPAATSDKTIGAATPQYSFNYGSGAARTKNGNVVVAYADDAGTTQSKQSVYVRTGKVDVNKNVTWGKAKLVSPATQISDRATVATGKTNNNIYVVWASQTGYGAHYNPDGVRVAYFSSFIPGTGWSTPTALTSLTGHVDYPVVAGSGNNVYVTYTDSDTGDVFQLTSANAGATWGSTQLGTTTRPDPGLGYGPEGLGAWPVNCAAGTNVATAWLDGSGNVKLSVSKTSGSAVSTKTITTSSTAGGDDGGWSNCDATGQRIGVTWNQDDGQYYTEYNTGSNSFTTATTKALALPNGGHTATYGGAVAISGASKVGIAAPLCVLDGCDYTNKQERIDLNWLESSNNGSSWSAPTLLSSSTVAGKYLNDSPSPLFYDANTRFVFYNGWNATYGNYRIYLSTGTG